MSTVCPKSAAQIISCGLKSIDNGHLTIAVCAIVMIIFLIKLIAAPLLLALATLAARRWGTVLGGILIGLPLISGPISVFLAIENGAGFAVETARGALAGTVALAVFTCVYAAVCP